MANKKYYFALLNGGPVTPPPPPLPTLWVDSATHAVQPDFLVHGNWKVSTDIVFPEVTSFNFRFQDDAGVWQERQGDFFPDTETWAFGFLSYTFHLTETKVRRLEILPGPGYQVGSPAFMDIVIPAATPRTFEAKVVTALFPDRMNVSWEALSSSGEAVMCDTPINVRYSNNEGTAWVNDVFIAPRNTLGKNRTIQYSRFSAGGRYVNFEILPGVGYSVGSPATKEQWIFQR